MSRISDDPDLQHLLSRVSLGDRHAFRELYDACAPRLLGVALRLLRRRDQAEDVLQDAFVAVWHRAATYSPQASQPMTWLTAIVRNRALDLLRGRERDVVESGSSEDADERLAGIEDDTPGPLNLLEQAADSLHIRGCLDAIDGPQRQCLALAYYHGLSHSELAGHLGAPLGSVKVWLRRGIDRLRRCLEALA
ncbi:MAG: sigma-70 family RNA polymerase sigma factor [Pseudazoarcus pumilus]|nr:sigma-70 family RNA polymerase sigma factor [Pseudazoarcus pumilus]